MFAVGGALAAERSTGSVVMTTTTKMSAARTDGFATLVGTTAAEVATAARQGPVLAWRSIDGSKALGYPPEFCDALRTEVDHVLVEADGARRKPLTAPGPFEPVIPSSATHVVALIGADALGRCIGDQCHRPMRVAAAAGCRPYDRLTPERAARVLLSDRGLRKSVPPTARFVVAITKVGDPPPSDVDELMSHLDGTPVIAILSTPL